MFPLCSSFTGVKPLLSASTIIANRPCGSHNLVVDGRTLDEDVPDGEILKSASFTVGGIRWRIKVYPNDFPIDIEDDEVYSLYSYHTLPRETQVLLVLDHSVVDPVKARAKLSVMAEQRGFFSRESKPKVQHAWEGAYSFRCKGDCTGTGFDRSKMARLLRRNKTDHFTIRCEVVVINGFRTTEALSSVAVPPSVLHKHLGALLVTGTDADVVFEVGGQAFPAHRSFLAARFSIMCKELLAAAAGVVRVDGMQPRVFGALLGYAYTDVLPEVDEEDGMYQDLLVAADRFGLVRLKMFCEDKLCRRVDARNVVDMLALAEKHRCDRLKKACVEVLNNAPAKRGAAMAIRGL